MTNMVEGNITNQYPLTKIRNYYRMGDGILDGYPIIQDQTSPNLAHIPTTNLIRYSEDFSQGYFNKTSITVTSSSITSPDGLQSSFKLVPDNGTGGNRSIGRNFTSLTGLHTISVYGKKGEYNYLMLRTRNSPSVAVMFDLENGTSNLNLSNSPFISSKMENVGNGWYRCSMTVDPSQPITTGQIYASISVGITGSETNDFDGNGTSGIYIYGFQFEAQSQATAYIKSDGIAAVRKSSTTNLVNYSEDFSQDNWSRYLFGGGNLVTTYGYESPNGLYNATKFEVTLGTGGILLTDNTTVSATENYTLSVWMRGEVGGEKVKIDFKNNGSTGPSGEIFTLTTDWIRYEVTRTNDGGTDRGFQFRVTTSQISSDQTFYVYGSQLEQQTQAETYAKTTGLPVTISLFTENNYGTMTNMSASDIVEDTP
jgi:hypothetical protein